MKLNFDYQIHENKLPILIFLHQTSASMSILDLLIH